MTNQEAPILELRNLTKSFPVPGGDELVVLDSIDLVLHAGESAAVVGPSGSGKTTLLNLVGAMDRPTSGEVLLDGRLLKDLDDRGLARLRNGRIGFVFQQHRMLPQLTVWENVLLPTAAGGEVDENVQTRADTLLDRVGLTDRGRHFPAMLSGGELQRAAVVRALINRPGILLADEPTGSLDGHAAGQLGDLLRELNVEENVTLITATHDEALAARMARMLHLDDGHLTEDGASS